MYMYIRINVTYTQYRLLVFFGSSVRSLLEEGCSLYRALKLALGVLLPATRASKVRNRVTYIDECIHTYIQRYHTWPYLLLAVRRD